MTDEVVLRDMTDADLPIFFEHEQDPVANYMAAFTPKDPADRNAFDAHWAKIRNDPRITIKTVLLGEGVRPLPEGSARGLTPRQPVVGHVASFGPPGELEVTYWLDRSYWGRGIATRALAQFLELVTERPVMGRAAKDNIASIRVLQKCGFVITGESKWFANARGKEIEEVILKLQEKKGTANPFSSDENG